MHINQPLLQAYLLAASKQYDEALELLNSNPVLKSDETAMELRARILKEKGDTTAAKQAWTDLLLFNSENITAKEVLCNITGVRGWLWATGKYVLPSIAAGAVLLVAFLVGHVTKKSTPETTPVSAEDSYAVFIAPEAWTKSTTAKLQSFFRIKETNKKTLHVFYENQILGDIVFDIAHEQGLPEDKIIRQPMYNQSALSVGSKTGEKQDEELRDGD